MPVVVANQLRLRGIEAMTARDFGALADDDIDHLRRAAERGCVLCTYDSDFVVLATDGIEHAGIVLGQPEAHSIGEWVKGLEGV